MGRFDSILSRFAEREKRVEEFRRKINDSADQIREGLKTINGLRVLVEHKCSRQGWVSEVMVIIDTNDREVLALETFYITDNLGVDQIVEQICNKVLDRSANSIFTK